MTSTSRLSASRTMGPSAVSSMMPIPKITIARSVAMGTVVLCAIPLDPVHHREDHRDKRILLESCSNGVG